MLEDKSKRPKINLPTTSTERFISLFTLGVIVLTYSLVLLAWDRLPEIIPTHYGPSGQVDGTGPKWTIWIVPVVQVFLAGMISVVCRFPHSFNYPWPITRENAGRQYFMARFLLKWLRLVTTLIFAYLTWGTIDSALNKTGGLNFWFLPTALVLVFGSLFVYIKLAARMR